jgi:hypothetical protein
MRGAEDMGKSLDRDRLASYGTPPELIETFDRMAKRGAFDEEPPEELLERTLRACLEQVPENEEYPLILPIPLEAPVVYMRHHGLRHLGIWDSSEFGGVREICRNVAASRHTIPLVLDVLRHPGTYSAADYETLWRQWRDEACDLSFIPGPAAAELGIRDIIVAEPAGVFSLSQTPPNAHMAVAMLMGSPCSDPHERYQTRMKLRDLSGKAVIVKRGGVFEPRFARYCVNPEGVAEAIAETYTMGG